MLFFPLPSFSTHHDSHWNVLQKRTPNCVVDSFLQLKVRKILLKKSAKKTWRQRNIEKLVATGHTSVYDERLRWWLQRTFCLRCRDKKKLHDAFFYIFLRPRYTRTKRFATREIANTGELWSCWLVCRAIERSAYEMPLASGYMSAKTWKTRFILTAFSYSIAYRIHKRQHLHGQKGIFTRTVFGKVLVEFFIFAHFAVFI